MLDEAQILRLLAALAEHRLYALACTTGMRQAELRWPAADLETRTLVVPEQLQRVKDKDGKRQLHREDSTKNRKGRTILLSPGLAEVLRAHAARQEEEKLILGEGDRGGQRSLATLLATCTPKPAEMLGGFRIGKP